MNKATAQFLLVFVCVAVLAVPASAASSQITAPLEFSGGQDGSLNDGGSITFTFSVTQSGTIQDVDLQLAMDHEYLEDLVVTLESPNGTSVEILTNFYDDEAILDDATFDDDVTTQIGSETSPFEGTYRVHDYDSATNTLDLFDDEDAQGTWNLTIEDECSGDTGTVYRPGNSEGYDGTKLIVTIPEPATVGMVVVGAGVLAMFARRRRSRRRV